MLRSWARGCSRLPVSRFIGINPLHKASPALTTEGKNRVFLGWWGEEGIHITWVFIRKCLLRLERDGKLQVKDQGRVIQSHLKKGEKWKALWKDKSICKGVHCHGSLVKEESQRQPVVGPIRALW